MIAPAILLPTTGSWAQVRKHAALADRLGYSAINCSHISARDSFTTLAGLADVAPRADLGVAVAPIYHRTPASMAQTAATVDDVTGGRFRLGLGVGHRVTMANWHGQEIGSPLTEMREYAGLVRALLAGAPATTGERWRSTFAFAGFTPRLDLPIYLAGLSVGMLALAGEIADGIVLWACPASYVREVVVPTVRAARVAAGKDPDSFAILAAVPCAATDDPERAMDGMRGELVRYFGLPFYRRMFAAAGYAGDIAAYDAADSDAGRRQAIGADFIADLCAIGDSRAVAEGVGRYRAAGPVTPMISNVAGTDFASTLHAAVAAS
ncbi:LLM class F420-dependent oxidoreductase [Pseudonocardia eucalypti]|uniref:LLM class F420-dependent oxidoreductase n=1 Tax=Pseudonocardia eucalypti TaxID=648755 RepID=A0ABP9QJP8_9PSEU|nr:alkanesulfonate monooxygenase SsuD/methylene tetrahydromethanopterin reductase-like flavin-dependent oxidoreductase (luciferase family) [Pseudonocardia eucalypti]